MYKKNVYCMEIFSCRLSLDVSKSSSCPSDTSKGSVLYSASQVCGDQDEGSEVMEEESVNFDDTLSDLEAVSLGLPGSQRQKNLGLNVVFSYYLIKIVHYKENL